MNQIHELFLSISFLIIIVSFNNNNAVVCGICKQISVANHKTEKNGTKFKYRVQNRVIFYCTFVICKFGPFKCYINALFARDDVIFH